MIKPGRLLAWGLALGAVAGGLVGLIEAGWLFATAFGYFDGPLEMLRLLAGALGLGAAAGACVGLAQGAAAVVVEGGARMLANKTPLPVWRARLTTALMIAPVAWVCAQIFRGPRAQQIPGHRALALLIGAAVLAAFYGAVRVMLARLPSLTRRSARVLAAAYLVGAVGLHAANQEILPRLYGFFHLGLDGAVLVAAELAVLAVALHGKRNSGLRSLIVGSVALACGVLALRDFGQARALRTLVVEHAATLGRVLHASGRLRGAPPVVPVAVPAPAEAEASLPAGPHLGDVDIFLITIDALRADRLTPAHAPRLSALAAQGVRFARAYTQVPHTSFSVATLLTGKHVFAQSALGLDPARHQTLAGLLKRERFKTAAFFPPSVFYIDRERLKSLEESSYGFEYVKYEYLAAPERTAQIVRFFEEEKPERAFVWAHYLEPHEPYEVHPGFTQEGATSARDRYDGEVKFVDAEIGKLLDWIRAHRPRALVVLAADHGEELGEHGGHYHGTTLYDEQVRVPLVFAGVDSGLLPAREVGGVVGLVDVAPTLLSLLGVPRSLKMRGRDLGPWMGESALPPPPGPVFAEIGRKKMIVSGDDKVVCDVETDGCEHYDLKADAGEHRDLAGRGGREAELRGKLLAWMEAEARYERGVEEGGDARVRRVLERGRMGERGAVRELAVLVGNGGGGAGVGADGGVDGRRETGDARREARDVNGNARREARDGAARPEAGDVGAGGVAIGVRREAARLLAALPVDGAVRGALEEAGREGDVELGRWVDVGLLRLGDVGARGRVGEWAPAVCGAKGERELCARAALASGAVALLVSALERAGDDALDFELQVQVVRALGETRDARALEPLILQLGQVRTRLETVRALGKLGDARALDTVLPWMPAEPYIPVRAALAELSAALARTPGDRARAREALTALRAGEREPAVRAAADSALARLGR